MPSFGDSIFIFVLALLLFGPKKLPELARQLGKLMGEFRRASADFRMQMEDELRISEQAEQTKKLAAIEAESASTAPAITPIATEGELSIMPPSTGLPVANSDPLGPLVLAIPSAEAHAEPIEEHVITPPTVVLPEERAPSA